MKRRFFSVLGIVSIMLVTFISCDNNKNQDEQNGQNKEEINLNYGACIYEDSTGYSILDFENNSYKEVDSELVIRNFNKASEEYLYSKNQTYYIHSKNDEIEIGDKNVQVPKFSPNGEYLFYFVKDEYLKPTIYDIKNNEKVDLKINCSISGTFASWLGDNKIAYYGVDVTNKVSGIFTYNLVNNEEKLEYEISGGYISFIKSFDTECIFFVEKYDGNKELKSLSTNGTVIDISNSLSEIYDLQMIEDKIYVLGRMIDNVYSLYDLGSNKRLVFDFPKVVNFDKGLSITEDGAVLFLGNNDGSNTEKIYAYSNDSVYLLNENSGSYTFIDIN